MKTKAKPKSHPPTDSYVKEEQEYRMKKKAEKEVKKKTKKNIKQQLVKWTAMIGNDA